MPLRYRIVNPSLWLQGLFIVFALLGHDLLMASRAPVAAMAATEGDVHKHDPTHAAVDILVSRPDGHPHSPHPSACGIGGTALLQPAAQLGVADLTTPAAIAPSHFPAAACTDSFPWEEPHWPPGTRRALLQVYRI